MTDTPFLDHRAIRKLAEQTPKLSEILAQRELFDLLDPITPATVGNDAPLETKGYFASSDGRIILRLVTQDEAQELFGVDACNVAEAFLIADRLAQIGEIEQAAMDAQARAVKLLRAVETMWGHIANATEISRKDRQRIAALIHEIRRDDSERADKIAAMRECAGQANRDRKWAMKQLGVMV